jgi:phage gpG-like protein
MPSSTKLHINLEPLKELQKNLKNPLITKVGVIGSKTNRTKDGNRIDNAFIGAVHLFGSFTRNIPIRDWLKMPLLEKKDKLLQRLKLFMKILLPKGNIKRIYKLLGIEAEAIIQQSFETQGFGKWKKIKSETAKRKGSSQILIDTGQLRKAVISKVEVKK